MRPTERPRIGLVLGSGGARGIVHISVIEALLEMGIPIDLISASSIGAVIAGVYAAGALKPFREDLAAMKKEVVRNFFDPALSRSGLFAGRKALAFLSHYIPSQTRIEDLPIPLGIVTTNYDTGVPVVFKQGNLLDSIRASISIPGIFTPSPYGSTYLIDGGVSNPLPIDVANKMGANLTIAVSLHPAIGKLGLIEPKNRKAQKRADGPAPLRIPSLKDLVHRFLEGEGWSGEPRMPSARKSQTLPEAAETPHRKRPNLFEIIVRTIDIMEYTNSLLMLAACPPTVLIEFNFPEIAILDFTMSEFLLEEGRKKTALKRNELIEKIKLGK